MSAGCIIFLLVLVVGASACLNDTACVPADQCKVAYCYLSSCAQFDKFCEEKDICSVPACDPERGCYHTPKSCDDGNACTVDACDTERGCYSEPLKCNDDDPCTRDACDPEKGCIFTSLGCKSYERCSEDGKCISYKDVLPTILIIVGVSIIVLPLAVVGFIYFSQIKRVLSCRASEVRT